LEWQAHLARNSSGSPRPFVLNLLSWRRPCKARLWPSASHG
jgi:hypothetical protein